MGQGAQGPDGDQGPQGLQGKSSMIEGNNVEFLKQISLSDPFIRNLSKTVGENTELSEKLSNVFVSNPNFNNVLSRSILDKAEQVSFLDNMNILWCNYGVENDNCLPYYSMTLKSQGGLIVGNDLKGQGHVSLVTRRDNVENTVRMLNNFNIKIGGREVFSGNNKQNPIINGATNEDEKFKNVLFHGDLKTNTLRVKSLGINDKWTISKNNQDLYIFGNAGSLTLRKNGDFST
jgi:hypothetical protein